MDTVEQDLKRTGYALLSIGIVMILGAVLQMILVFTGILPPVQVFSFSSSDFAIEGSALFPQLPTALTEDLKVEVFPAELINTVLNFGLNTMLMWIIIFAGGKIATIGTTLLRPVYVKMKTNES